MANAVQEPATMSPLLTLEEAAAYIGRTPKGLRRLRERRSGPPGFRVEGRVMYRLTALNDYLAACEARDSRSNPALDPTRRAPEPRRIRRPAAA
ncbi:helix-turn-helix domain-containing protein [Kitasatospora sp. A2-31]|uniref:helix-turn-helix domain-containing protein n=1 Tax=Kitasatospora sp. A2-31 TaxID=2916414 RepID=UPI001EED73C1|nr:helix-turn-helix domain-containing protein [Kitasatospora sp. A2-31]MCG6499420.1 helix-turn-helix domain-containing protein [Kitasatospora sp. A2-31]